jgi:hypothetical protein
VRRCRRLIELDRLLPAVLRGKARPATATEGLELADLCQMPCKRLYAASARLAADAFAADPRLADDLRGEYRYYAACAALLAAGGEGADAGDLDDEARGRWRRQGLAWLRAHLGLYDRLARGADPRAREAVRRRLGGWRQESDLTSVRDKGRLARLPGPERAAWRRLWDDVAALQKVVHGEE